MQTRRKMRSHETYTRVAQTKHSTSHTMCFWKGTEQELTLLVNLNLSTFWKTSAEYFNQNLYIHKTGTRFVGLDDLCKNVYSSTVNNKKLGKPSYTLIVGWMKKYGLVMEWNIGTANRKNMLLRYVTVRSTSQI